MTCIEINPGAKKVIKGTPSTSPLSAPIARDKTSKKSKDEISGEKIVCDLNIYNEFKYNNRNYCYHHASCNCCKRN